MTRAINPLAHVKEGPTQAGLVKFLREVLPIGSRVAAVLNEGVGVRSTDPHARARYFAARKAAGMLIGFPDLIIACPHGVTIYLETKRPVGGVLSVAQQDVHASLRALGHHVGVATSPETALTVLQAAGVLLRHVHGLVPAVARVRLARRDDRLNQRIELP